MLTISAHQLSVIAADRKASVITDVSNFMLKLRPDWQFTVSGPELKSRAERWVDESADWNIDSARDMCQLLEIRMRWGSFHDPDSQWILDVLNGPLEAADKIEFLLGAMYGE
jgi:hypothetical protein